MTKLCQPYLRVAIYPQFTGSSIAIAMFYQLLSALIIINASIGNYQLLFFPINYNFKLENTVKDYDVSSAAAVNTNNRHLWFGSLSVRHFSNCHSAAKPLKLFTMTTSIILMIGETNENWTSYFELNTFFTSTEFLKFNDWKALWQRLAWWLLMVVSSLKRHLLIYVSFSDFEDYR